MTEQHTIREVIAVARDWGPLWTCAALFVIYQIVQHIHLKRKSFDPLTKLQLEVNDKPSYKDLSEKLKEYQRKDVAEAYGEGIDKRLDAIESLLHQINDKIK